VHELPVPSLPALLALPLAEIRDVTAKATADPAVAGGVTLLPPAEGRMQAVDDAFGFLIVGDGDGEIDVLGEPGLRAERHRQAADDGLPGTDGIEIRSGLPEDRVDGLHCALPACRQL
jgi:hypothetical protein